MRISKTMESTNEHHIDLSIGHSIFKLITLACALSFRTFFPFMLIIISIVLMNIDNYVRLLKFPQIYRPPSKFLLKNRELFDRMEYFKSDRYRTYSLLVPNFF